MVNLFQSHSRSFEHNRHVYPVVSRRARGMSIGVDLCPGRCTFRCVYCSEFGALTSPPAELPTDAERVSQCAGRGTDKGIDLELLRHELTAMLAAILGGEIFLHPPFDETPDAYRRLNDIALSGSGEPTLSPAFEAACALIGELGQAVRGQAPGQWPHPKLVLITNATALCLPSVWRGLDALSASGAMEAEIWAKLDAGTTTHYAAMNRARVPFDRVLQNLLAAGQRHRIVIQSLFGELDGRPPSTDEIDAWLERLEALRQGGADIAGVQVYTVARKTAEPTIRALPDEALMAIAERVRTRGFAADWFGCGR